ncbi:MAG: amidohydrolase [Clostridia bacterium]|nr:amidohydrolase [Clostridia bacterium]
MKTLLKNAYIVTMDPEAGVYTRGYVIVDGNRIACVAGGEAPLGGYDEVIDCEGRIVMPSFINTHVHTSQQLGRGLGDDVPLLVWLHDRIWPYESNMTEDDSYVSTLLCCAEQIKAGCTLFAEPGGQYVSGMARAVKETGIRGKLANSIMDCGEGLPKKWVRSTDEEIARTVEDIKNFHNTADGRVQVWFGLRTIFNNSDELILRSKEMADKYGVGVHMHVAEVRDEVEYLKAKIGVQTVTHLNDLGVLDKNFLAVHTVWLTNEEVGMFRDHGVKVSHNPAAAMRVLGFAKVPRMLREGICVTIGTDGAPSNNRMDIVDEMWLTSLIHKGWRLEPDVVKAEEVLRMVTVKGAEALMEEDNLGSLTAGKKADLIIIDPRSAGMLPLHDPVANLVSSMHSDNIQSTMCDGKWLMRERRLLTIDEDALYREAQKRADAIRSRAGIVIPDRFPTHRS